MGLGQNCKQLCHGTDQDVLQLAPCPPPYLSYKEFREHALSRNLTHLEVCSISRRCRPFDPDVEEDCKKHEDLNLKVVIIIVCVIAFLAVCIILFVSWRRRRKKHKNVGETQGDVPSPKCEGNKQDIGQSSDIQMTEREASTVISHIENPEEHNRRGDSNKNIGSDSNDTLDSETEAGSDLEHYDQINIKHKDKEENEAHSYLYRDLDTGFKTGCEDCSIKRRSGGSNENQTKIRHKGGDGELYTTRL